MASNGGDAEAPVDVATGLPVMSVKAKEKSFALAKRMIPGIAIMPRLIGCCTAYLIYGCVGPAAAEARMRKLNASLGFDHGELGYFYLAVGAYSLIVALLNMGPMYCKSQVMPGNAGNLRANMQIYKVNVSGGTSRLPYVVLEEHGDIGRYNRANRALFNFVENTPGFGPVMVCVGLMYPRQALLLVPLFGLVRLWYQYAYTNGGYGMACCKHGVPFVISMALIAPALEMLVWGTGVRMLTLQ